MLTFEEYEEIVFQLEEWNKSYRTGNPQVPDIVYDRLLEKLPDNHPYINKIEAEVLYKGRIKHDKPMLSMQKSKTRKDISKWIDKVKSFYNGKPILVKCTAKLDGIAGKLTIKNLTTRGDGIFGNDISNAFQKGLVLEGVQKIKPFILGELVVKLDYFKENLETEFSHPRNFVSGAIMADSLNSISEKAFKENAVVFQSYIGLPKIVSNIDSLLDNFRDTEKSISNSANYKIDGVIFEVVNEDIKELMGETESYPNWAIALKPKDDVYSSLLLRIEWQAGRTGKITPVAIIEPVIIDGVEVRRATAHNARNVLDMGLKPGVRIELIRSGSVIPYIVSVLE